MGSGAKKSLWERPSLKREKGEEKRGFEKKGGGGGAISIRKGV